MDSDQLAASFLEHSRRLLVEFGPEVSTSCSPDPPGGHFFVAEARVKTPCGEVRMIYGDREFEIRTSIKPFGRPWPIELTLYLRAMKLDESGVSDSMWIRDEDRMLGVLKQHVGALRLCLPKLEDEPRPWWSLAEQERQASIAAGSAQLRIREMNAAIDRATDAFRNGDFQQVVSLLTPYTDILSEAQSRKLETARDRVGS